MLVLLVIFLVLFHLSCDLYRCQLIGCTGHFLLTNLLLDKMKVTAESSGVEGRIVNLSSIAHLHTYKEGIRFDKINDQDRYRFLFYLKFKSDSVVILFLMQFLSL